MVPPVLKRFPTSLLLAVALVLFVGSVLVFTLPFEVTDVGPTNATAACGPPWFEFAASDYSSPSTIVPPGTTAEPSPLASVPSSTTTSIAVWGAPPGTPPTGVGTSVASATASTATTLATDVVKQACGAPASKRLLIGGLGMLGALVVGYLARLRRTAKFGYVAK